MSIGDVYHIWGTFTDSATGGKELTTGFHVQQGGPTWDGQGVMQQFYDWWDVGLGGQDPAKGERSSDVSLLSVQSRRIDPLEPVIESLSESFPVVGSGGAGTNLPINCCMLVSLRTAAVGRSYRGRMYLPGLFEADSTGNWDETKTGDAAAQITAMLTAIIGLSGGGNPVVHSATVPANTIITDVFCDRRVRSQRRRQSAAVYVSG